MEKFGNACLLVVVGDFILLKYERIGINEEKLGVKGEHVHVLKYFFVSKAAQGQRGHATTVLEISIQFHIGANNYHTVQTFEITSVYVFGIGYLFHQKLTNYVFEIFIF